MTEAVRLCRALGSALYGEAKDAGVASEHGRLLVRLARAHNYAADALEADEKARLDIVGAQPRELQTEAEDHG